MVDYQGELFSLMSAVLWALAVIFFRKSGERVHPLALNSFKNFFAFILLIPTIYIFNESLLMRVPVRYYLIPILSGVIGIGIGDTLFLSSLNFLGAGLTSIVVCMYSPFVIALSILFLDEHLLPTQIVGAVLIILAILIASLKKKGEGTRPKRLWLGIFLGVLASVAMASGIVIVKPLLLSLPLLWVTEIRLLGGIIVLAVILGLIPDRVRVVNSLIKTKSWTYSITGALIGAYLAMVVWLAGMKYTQASIASVLNQTSTIFVFIFAGIILKEPISLRRILGIVLAFIGSLLVILK